MLFPSGLSYLHSSIEQSAGAGGEVWPPVGAIIAADFVGGRYYANGSAKTQAEFMTLNAGTLDGGLHTVDDEEPPNAEAAVLTSLNANLAGGITVVWDGLTTGASWEGLIGLYPEADPAMAGVAVEVLKWSGGNTPRLDDWNEASAHASTSYVAASRNRVAITILRDAGGGVYRNAVSVNGGAVVPGTSSEDLSYSMADHLTEILYASICGTSEAASTGGADGSFTTFTVYPAVDESELATLSALP